MGKLAVGYRYKCTGFHYDMGGWISYCQYVYEDQTLSDWYQHDNIVHSSRQDAEEFCRLEQGQFFRNLYRKLNGPS